MHPLALLHLYRTDLYLGAGLLRSRSEHLHFPLNLYFLNLFLLLVFQHDCTCLVLDVQIQQPVNALVRAQLLKLPPPFAAVASELVARDFSAFLNFHLGAKLFALVPVPLIHLALREVTQPTQLSHCLLVPVDALSKLRQQMLYLVFAFANSIFLLSFVFLLFVRLFGWRFPLLGCC